MNIPLVTALQMPGGGEWLLILLAVLLLFGARKLPELARALGKSLGEFKKGRAEGESSAESPKEDDAQGKTSTKNGGASGNSS